MNAITILENDQLLTARLTDGNCEIMMAIKSGRAIRFPEENVTLSNIYMQFAGGGKKEDAINLFHIVKEAHLTTAKYLLVTTYNQTLDLLNSFFRKF